MSKKRPPLQRFIASFLGYLEARTPAITRCLRYHSQIISPVSIPDTKALSRSVRWHEPRYKESYEVLASTGEGSAPMPAEPENFSISLLSTNDYVIHGHIKAPIINSNGLALSYIPLSRLSINDSYPLPIFRTRMVAGTIIFIPDIENYFHLMVDYLLPPLCGIVRDPESYSHVTFVMQRNFPIVQLFSSLLNNMGISTSIIIVGRFDRVTGGALLFGGAQPQDSAAAFAYSNEMHKFCSMIDKYLPTTHTPRRIYVTRKNAPRRRILNEMEVRALLNKYNVETVELNFANPIEQILLFRNAELIISVHGAALTNLIWSKSAKVIEVFPKNLRPKHYLNIASQMGLDYREFIGFECNQREDFEVNIRDFERFLGENIV